MGSADQQVQPWRASIGHTVFVEGSFDGVQQLLCVDKGVLRAEVGVDGEVGGVDDFAGRVGDWFFHDKPLGLHEG